MALVVAPKVAPAMAGLQKSALGLWTDRVMCTEMHCWQFELYVSCRLHDVCLYASIQEGKSLRCTGVTPRPVCAGVCWCVLRWDLRQAIYARR